MKRLALLLAARAVRGGPCADGTDKGSNGCCADNKCPPCTVIPVVVDDGTSITCTCSGHPGDTAHIDATCATHTGCTTSFPTRRSEMLDELHRLCRVATAADHRGDGGSQLGTGRRR